MKHSVRLIDRALVAMERLNSARSRHLFGVSAAAQHCPNRLVTHPELSGQLAEGVIRSQSEDGRSLRRRELTRPRLLIGRTGRYTDLTPRWRLGDDNSAGR